MDIARSIAVAGREAFNAGDYETAVSLFRRAYALYPAPTVVLYEARCLEKLGLLLEAADAYARTSRMAMHAGAPAQFAEAIAAAREEGRALEARVPSLVIKVAGVSSDDPKPKITINGQPVAPELYGQPQSLNPGTYRISGSIAPGRTREAEAQVQPGQHVTIVVDLGDHATTSGGLTASAAVDRAPVEHETDRGSIPVLVYTAGGVGIAGIGAGVITGLMANGKHQKAVAACADHRCPSGSNGPGLVSAFRSLRTVSTVSYGIGAAGIAAGVILWITTGKSAEQNDARSLTPWLTANTAGLRGTF
jgi:hypothetical protein